ncbi:restriction endonuclease subunit S [Acinetobacter albensis]|uniref:restriction endonuclease subunit S n=1 Tax=Acinetobacter albensis TaxID=1673609 RepID=UPI00187E255C|nr:restriction endonuclease subunit S [Acinetobacter albensis]MBE9400107.1 restriction endonuclease subunit S [Acinetobacter albensis]
MNKQKRLLVPKLRFPEFKNNEEWHSEHLGSEKVAKFIKNKVSLDELSLETYISTENLLPDFSGTSISTRLPPSGSFTEYKEADVLISNIRPYLKKVWQADRTGACSNDVIVIRAGKEIKPDFLNHILKNENFITYVMKSAKGVKMPRGDVSSIKAYPVTFPKFDEQQKIADFLYSLDNLIILHSQKLHTLKVYKKSLIQQLFPAEGEIVPKLRFPEFSNTKYWENINLDNIAKFVRGPFGGSLKKDIFVKKGYAVYEQQHAIYGNFQNFRYFISGEKFNELKRFEVKPNDLIMSCSGTMGKFSLVPPKAPIGVINQALLKITANSSINVNFLKEIFELPLNQEKLLSQAAGGAIKNVVGVDQIKKIVIRIPSLKEQQKIADLLSNIDELILNQTNKIEILRDHKKGLIQLLFPILEESNI